MTITIQEFLKLPVHDKPPFMVPGTHVNYVDSTLAEQFNHVKPGTARLYVLHYYSAHLDSYGNLKIETKMDQVIDQSVEAPTPIDFKNYLGKAKSPKSVPNAVKAVEPVAVQTQERVSWKTYVLNLIGKLETWLE